MGIQKQPVRSRFTIRSSRTQSRTRRAVSLSGRHVFAGMTSQPLSPPNQPDRQQQEAHQIERKPAVLSGCLMSAPRVASHKKVAGNVNFSRSFLVYTIEVMIER